MHWQEGPTDAPPAAFSSDGLWWVVGVGRWQVAGARGQGLLGATPRGHRWGQGARGYQGLPGATGGGNGPAMGNCELRVLGSPSASAFRALRSALIARRTKEPRTQNRKPGGHKKGGGESAGRGPDLFFCESPSVHSCEGTGH
jgi:hypothetical protein